MPHDSSKPIKTTKRVLFDKRSGTSDSGFSYEVHLLMLLLLRGLKEAETFYLGSNIKEAGAFDDVVFQYVYKNKGGHSKSKLVFLQAKHKESVEKHIIKESFLLSDKGDFCLNKYFSSYLEIKESLEFSNSKNSNFAEFVRNWKSAEHEFIIYTNIGIDPDYDNSKKWLKKGADKFLTSKNSSSKVAQLDARYNGHLVKKFSGEFDYMDHKRRKRPSTAKEITDFFVELKFFVNQSDVNDLEETIKREIISYYDVTQEDSASMYLNVKAKVQSWWKNSNFFLTENDDFFEMERQNIFKLQLEKLASISKQKQRMEALDIKYNKNGFKNIRTQLNQMRVINIVVEKGCVFLSSLKLFQVVNGIPEYQVDNNKVLFVRLKDLLYTHLQLLQALKFSRTYNLLVIECKMSVKNPEESNNVYSMLHDILLTTSDKKVILITDTDDRSNGIFENDPFLKDNFAVINDTISFSNLTVATQVKLMKNEVIFQGQKISLNDLFSQNLEFASKIIDLETLIKLTQIQNDVNLQIGVEPKRMHELEAAYGRVYEDISFIDLFDSVVKNRKVPIIFMLSYTEHSNASNVNIGIINDILSNVEDGCVLLTDSTNLLKEINNAKNQMVIIVKTRDCNENLLKVFKLMCGRNSNKIIYWVDVTSKQARIQQIYDPNFYLPRQLKYVRNVWINPDKIIKQLNNPNSSFVFIFQGVSGWNEFKLLFSKEDFKQNLLNDKKIQLFLSESEAYKGFQTFHDQGKLVHWLKVNKVSHNKKIIWYRSNCSLDVIQKCINDNPNDYDYDDFEETEFIKRVKDKVVIIADEPGMGKSTTLTSLCSQMAITHTVIRIDFKDCNDAIFALPKITNYKEISVGIVLIFLSNINSLMNISNITKAWLKCSLTHTQVSQMKPILFLFDGFDEISNDLQEKIIPLLQFLKYKTMATLWVTTRLHKKDFLENSLATFVTKFVEVSSPFQKQFLTNFWRVRLTLLKGAYANPDIYFAKLSKCADIFHYETDSILGENMAKFMGVPLQLRLLAEGYISEIKEFLKTGANENYFASFEHLNLLTLYQRFIDAKYNIYFKEKTQLDIFSNYVKRKLTESFDKDHQRLAFKALFPKQGKIEKEFFTGNHVLLSQEERDDFISLGFIQSIDSSRNIHFTHKTFAEYFTAMLFERFLHKRRNKFESAITYLGEVFKYNNNNYEVFHNFLNHALSRDSLLRTAILNNNYSKVVILLEDQPVDDSSDNLGKTALHLAAVRGNIDILKKLLDTGHDSFKQDAFGNAPLHYSVRYNHKEITNYLLNYNADIDIDNNLISRPLLLNTDVQETVFNNSGFENSALFKFISTRDVHSKTALEYAIEKDYQDIACLLLLYGASINLISEENKMKLFSYAAEIASSGYAEYHELSPVLALLAINTNSEIFGEYGDHYYYPRLLSYFYNYGHIKVIDAVLKTIHDPIRRRKLLINPDNSISPLRRVDSHSLLNDADYFQIIKYMFENITKSSNYSNNKEIVGGILKSAAIKGHLKTLKYFLHLGDKKDYNSLLYIASTENHFHIVKYLWDNYPHELTDKCGNTALHSAADRGTMRCIKYLVENGADVNACNDQGKTPLKYAAEESRFDVIKYLVANGANVNAVDNTTTFSLMQHGLIDSGRLYNYNPGYNIGKSVIEYAVAAYVTPNWDGQYPHIKKGENISILKYLLVNCNAKFDSNEFITNINKYFRNCDTFNVNQRTEEGMPRLHRAIQMKEFEWAKFLIRQGADVNELDRTSEGRTALHWAAVGGNLKIVEILLQCGAVYDKKDMSGRTPLNLCRSGGGQISWILLLLNKLFDSRNLMHDLNKNLLNRNQLDEHYLTWYPDVFDARNPTMLILNAQNTLGITLLHVAAETNDFEAAQCLLNFNRQYLNLKFEQKFAHARDYKSLNINTKDAHGNTPLHYAAKGGHYEVLVLLLQSGAIFNGKNKKGYTPEMSAKSEGFQNIFKCLQQIQKLFTDVEQRLTIDEEAFEGNNGTYDHAKNPSGKTLLHLAVCNGHADNAKFLIKTGSDMEARDEKNCTPLHYAAEYGFSEITALLLRKGCIFNAINSEGKTPADVVKIAETKKTQLLQDINTIFSYINEDGMTVLRLLQTMEKHDSANLNSVFNCKDAEGNTLLHLASKVGCVDLVMFILKRGVTYNGRNKQYETPRQLATDSNINNFLDFIDDLFSWKSHLNYVLEEIKEAGQLQIIQSVRDVDGKTILHNAVESNYYRIKFLVSNNQSLNVKDNSGKTIKESAKERGEHGVIKFLE